MRLMIPSSIHYFQKNLCATIEFFERKSQVQIIQLQNIRLIAVVCNNVLNWFVHFLVERRRRFNINDRIKELGTLLPKQQDQ